MPSKKPADTTSSTPKNASTTDKVKGPASYFPAIEQKYGKPIDEWKQMIAASGLTKHKELVDWLKSKHGMGHGHATALVAHTLAG